MTKYREIIRLTGLGFSQRNIIAQERAANYSGVPTVERLPLFGFCQLFCMLIIVIPPIYLKFVQHIF